MGDYATTEWSCLKKILAISLSVVLVVGLCPGLGTTALAKDAQDSTTTQQQATQENAGAEQTSEDVATPDEEVAKADETKAEDNADASKTSEGAVTVVNANESEVTGANEDRDGASLQADNSASLTSVSPTFGGGSGTEVDPYLILDSTDMQSLTDAVAAGDTYAGKFFKLNDTINLSNTISEWKPIGNETSVFKGTFDGNNCTIKGMKITADAGYLGLFGQTGGTIKNLTVAGTITTSTTKDYIGGIAGKLSCGGTIENCTNQVAITATGAYNVGGIAGVVGEKQKMVSSEFPMATINQCKNEEQISGKKPVGGIAGHNAGTIESCYNKGTIIGNNGSSKGGYGGICGYNGVNYDADDAGIVKDCFNVGYVNNQNSKWAGGLVGFQNSKSTLSNSYNAGCCDYSPGRTYPLIGQNEGKAYDCLWLKEDTGDKTKNYVASDGLGTDTGATNCVAKTRSELKAADCATFLNTVSSTSSVGTNWLKSYSPEGFESFPILSWMRTTVDVNNPVEIKFTVTPADAEVVVTTKDGKLMVPESIEGGVSTFKLEKDATYSYAMTKDGYASYQMLMVAYAGNDISVDLHQLEVATKTVTGGDTIEAGGTYQVVGTTPGVIKITTSEKVSLTGTGFADSSKLSNIAFDASTQNSNVEVHDMFVSLKQQGNNLFNFGTTTSTISFEGTTIFDYDIGFSAQNNAVLHIGPGGKLTIAGGGTYYQYNNTQGAGIGGVTGEMNGDIVFCMDGSGFIKGTRQGAVIGAGAQAKGSGTPGSVTFEKGTYNLISNSRGAVIGGSAGDGGASEGTTVYIKGGTININCDYSGTAIGGGGYASGSDASGGTAYITGGNLRMYVDKNAMENVGTEPYWHGLTLVEGVTNVSMTAQRKNALNEDLYMAAIDTTGIDADADGNYTVEIDGEKYFTGGLNSYSFTKETVDRESPDGKVDTNVQRTCDNWQKSVDPNIYVYMTPGFHTITVNGQTRYASFNKIDIAKIDECNGGIFPVNEEWVTASFVTGSGSAVVPQQVAKTGKVTKPEDNPVLVGSTFGGWYADVTYKTPFDWNKKITENTQIYAKWLEGDVTTHQVAFNTDGGSEIPTQTVADGDNVIDPGTQTKTGYKFEGWYKTEAKATGDEFDIKNDTVTDELTLYAKWTPITYKVQYESGALDATGTILETVATYDQAFTLNSNTTVGNQFLRTGYKLICWENEASGEKVYTSTSVKNLANTQDAVVKFKAVWQLENYTISYTLNSGRNHPSNPKSYNIESGAITLQDANKTGYNFTGWTTKTDSVPTKGRVIPAGSTGALTFIANYDPESYKITYEYADGALKDGETNPSTYTYTVGIDEGGFKSPTKDNYDFVAWCSDWQCKNEVKDIAKDQRGDITLYAKFTPKAYAITYDLNAGTDAVTNPNTATSHTVESDAIALFEPSRADYTFTGWTMKIGNNETQNVTSIPANTAGEVKLTANWIEAEDTQYTVNHKVEYSKGLFITVQSVSIKGTTGTQTQAEPLPTLTMILPGFVAPQLTEIQQQTIKADGSTTVDVKYTRATVTVSFDMNGKGETQTTSAVYGDKVAKPEDPTATGATFAGWYKDQACNYAWNFDEDTAGATDFTLYAKWNVVTQKMYRLYNSNNGEHFYTADEKEKDGLVKIGWNYEGVGWYAPVKTSVPVYRLNNPFANGGDHHYTTNKEEYDTLPQSGWEQEGIAFYSCEENDANRQPLYRLYNPFATTGLHNYTLSTGERDNLVEKGWDTEGVGWYGYAPKE